MNVPTSGQINIKPHLTSRRTTAITASAAVTPRLAGSREIRLLRLEARTAVTRCRGAIRGAGQ
jgi:hypothetical protein